MGSVRTTVGILSTAILFWPGVHARAEPQQPSGPPVMAAAAVSTPQSAQEEPVARSHAGGAFGSLGKPVGESKLDSLRGGAEVVVNDMRLHGTVADNRAINSPTGDNIITASSFANAIGIPTVIQNTGSNVLIQTGTIVNVQFAP
ncbi:hypothetical protein SAMN05216345_10877 [Cupriavidus sp. YR651]|uniref:hypothetical protein n=1 Tax=Cupriavidus sp. YR651 TaxID=1855315 RepID=UPI00087EB77A|nr:hypothetical protein [Cupriavidus sp. YR651]SDD35598.1 hypothetical protein SAMN05216345_10877 [Cupriavidus sp. YR651]